MEATSFNIGKLYTMCVNIVQNARWNASVLSLDIAAILLCTSLYLHPKVAMNSMFNMQEIKAAFSTRYCSVSHFILHGKTIYGVRLRCEEFPLKHNCFIQQCPWPNERPLKTLSLYVQYARVSSCFFYAILQCKPLYFHCRDIIQYAFALYRMRVET